MAQSYPGSPGHFQELLIEGMCDSQCLPEALEWLNQYCGSGSAQLIAVNDSNLILDSSIAGTVNLEVFEREAEFLPLNPRTKVFDNMPTGHIFHDSDIVDDEMVRTRLF